MGFWKYFSVRKQWKVKSRTKHIAFSYDYKLVCVDDKFISALKAYFAKDAVYNFMNSMIEESKYCS